MNNVLSNILRFLVVILLQVFVCNSINLFGFATPALYLMALLLLPFEIPLSVQYLIGFFTGMIIDMFTHTLGVNMAAATTIMYIRPHLVRLLNGSKTTEGIDKPIPGNKDFKWIFFYILTLSFIHQLIAVMLETCSFRNFGYTLLVILCNTLFTAFIIICTEYIFYPTKKSS